MTKIFKNEIFNFCKMNSFGETIRKLRKKKNLPLRTVSAFLDIDPAILSKIERGQRRANRKVVANLAAYFDVKERDLLVSWLSDKLLYEVGDEEMGLKALQVAEARISYNPLAKKSKPALISTVRTVLEKDGRVAEAWIYGSFVRGDDTEKSDLDMMIALNNKEKYSLFDLLDISHIIEKKINRKVDLVEKGFLKNIALENFEKEKIKIYG